MKKTNTEHRTSNTERPSEDVAFLRCWMFDVRSMFVFPF